MHGTLLGVINILFALSLNAFGSPEQKRVDGASKLFGSAVFYRLEAFTGGLHIYDGDPGLGIVFAPIGLAFIAALQDRAP